MRYQRSLLVSLQQKLDVSSSSVPPFLIYPPHSAVSLGTGFLSPIYISWKIFINLCGRFIQNAVYEIYQNRPSFLENMTKTFWLTSFQAHVVYIGPRATFSVVMEFRITSILFYHLLYSGETTLTMSVFEYL